MSAPDSITTVLADGSAFREQNGRVTQRPDTLPVMHAVTGADFARSMAAVKGQANGVQEQIRAKIRAALKSEMPHLVSAPLVGLATATTSPDIGRAGDPGACPAKAGESAVGNEAGRQPGHTLPHAAGSATSATAAESMEPHAAKQAAEVLSIIRAAGQVGRTCWEVEDETGLPHQSVSARITGLLRTGDITRTERTRPTASGRPASVLVAAKISP